MHALFSHTCHVPSAGRQAWERRTGVTSGSHIVRMKDAKDGRRPQSPELCLLVTGSESWFCGWAGFRRVEETS